MPTRAARRPKNAENPLILGFRRLRHNTARADILAADEPQPVDPLLVRELDALAVFLALFGHAAPDTQTRPAPRCGLA